jgi:beta-lactam-binding protein with PASTA domain
MMRYHDRAMRRAFYMTLLSVGATALTYLGMHFFIEPRLPVNAVEVPPIAGLSPEQARGLLEPRGLLLVLDSEKPDDRVSPGTLCEQTPLGGSRLRRGDLVHASLARSGGPHLVPKLVGLTADAARELLATAKLRVGRISDGPSDTIPRGQVAAVAPEVGTEVKIDSTVDLTLSMGPSTKEVPKVIGKRMSSAKKLLEEAGFSVGATKYGSNDDYDQGIVISQNPAAGSQASPGVKIDLTLND